jgi:hypothetical protein
MHPSCVCAWRRRRTRRWRWREAQPGAQEAHPRGVLPCFTQYAQSAACEAIQAIALRLSSAACLRRAA